MPRPLVIGNGNLLVTLDSELSIRDIFWPYVGLYNHLSGHRVRLGIWVDGTFSWLSDHGWNRDLQYEPNTLVTRAQCRNDRLNLTLTLRDCVVHREDILLRRFVIENHADTLREVRLFICSDFHINETDIGDTVFYNPFLDAIIHYKRDCYFLITAASIEGGIYQYSTGIKGFGGAEGTWRDAEDGILSMNPIEQGAVDSAISVRTQILQRGSAEIRSWMCAGRSLEEVARSHHRVLGNGFNTMMRETAHYWEAWSEKDLSRLNVLPAPIQQVFRRSLLTIRTNVDNRGAIIAANDSDIMQTARAHYSYMWPRDGALVCAAMDRLGYQDLTRRFFLFCKRVLPKDRAAFMHKYSADGSWGATWHPWTVEGFHEIPIQEDSTALVVWALWKHYQRYRDIEFIESVYDEMLLPCANFLADHRDKKTKLPAPSYDLWEERRGIHAYTCGAVYGALIAAANLSNVFRDGHADRFRKAAREVQEGIAKYLWNDDLGRFVRRLVISDGENYVQDLTIDSALHALHSYGAFSPNDPRIERTMRAIISRLWIQTSVGGIARYENDYYFRRSYDIERVPGNPWFICTLWAAQWYIAHAKVKEDLLTGLELLLWAAHRVLPSGIMPEQLHPETGEPLSVAPLTWSHAEFIATTLDYLDRLNELQQ
jgi:GH15 family glucan-1,4-alpha-glucosidase